MTEYKAGQYVIYRKRGEQPCYDTDWPAIYQRRTGTGRHVIKIHGRKRVSIVRDGSIRSAQSEESKP